MRRLLLVTVTPLLLAAFFFAAPTATAQESSLSGTVLDQDGQPVADAEVRVTQYRGGDGGMTCEQTSEPEKSCAEPVEGYAEPVQGYEARARTDSAGAFAVAVHDGRLHLQVNKEGYAGHWQDLDIDGSAHLDIEMLRYPDKTARIVGQVTGGGQPLASVSVSVENPEYGIYECSVRGNGEVPRPAGDAMKGSTGSGTVAGSSTGSGTAASSGSPSPASSDSGADADAQAESPERVESTVVSPEPYPYHQCAIEVDADGSFSGNVTPGYTILRFHRDGWSDGPGYYPQSRVLDLPADTATRIDVDLVPRPGPDARLSGYAVDGSTDEAIPGVQISFSNQDAYGWASARTDADGSYRVALRSGYTSVHVWADGYFPWEGQVRVGAGDDRAFDIVLTPGESRYGGCCIAYADAGEVRALEGEDAGGAPAGSASASSSTSSETSQSDGDAASEDGDSSDGASFEDLGGGLGPYDPASRESREGAAVHEDTPAAGLLLALAALVAVLWVRRW